MQDSSAVLRLGGRRLAAVVAAGAVAVTLFAGAWAQGHKFDGSAAGNGRKLSVVKVVKGYHGRGIAIFTVASGRKLSKV